MDRARKNIFNYLIAVSICMIAVLTIQILLLIIYFLNNGFVFCGGGDFKGQEYPTGDIFKSPEIVTLHVPT